MDHPFLEEAELALLRDDQSGALQLARIGLTLLPDDTALRELAAICAGRLGRHAEAADDWAQLQAGAPTVLHYANELALALQRLERNDEAEAQFRAALRQAPDDETLLSNLGVLLHEQGRDDEAERCFRAALASAPAHATSRANLGQLLLAQGRFAEGWPFNEARVELMPGADDGPLMPPGLPQWQGESLHGKTLLVMPEQGLGDEIQFCRYLRWLKSLGPKQLILVCRSALLPLLQALDGPDRVIALPQLAGVLPEADAWVWLLSLPGLAGTTPATIPADVPYLRADPQRVARLALPGDSGRCRVGLVWHGNPRHDNDAERSLPGPQTLAPLWQVPGVDFFSLQLPADDAWPADLPCTDLAPRIGDFADTAALLASLDLLITVDTSAAHLAGALGRPCWLLLPAWKTDWRWLRGRDDTPWYPSLRLFRQPARGDWATPVARIAAALADFAGHGGR